MNRMRHISATIAALVTAGKKIAVRIKRKWRAGPSSSMARKKASTAATTIVTMT
ncbi:hypothetical protein D3C77_740180 [compost metagenome]